MYIKDKYNDKTVLLVFSTNKENNHQFTVKSLFWSMFEHSVQREVLYVMQRMHSKTV